MDSIDALGSWLYENLSLEMTREALDSLTDWHRPELLAKRLASALFGLEYQSVDRLSGNLEGVLEGIQAVVSLMIGNLCPTSQGQTSVKHLKGILEKVIFAKSAKSEGASSSAATPEDVAVAMGGMVI